MKGILKGPVGLFVAVAMMVICLIFIPDSRWFLLVSVLLGGVIGGVLYWWNSRH